MVFKQRGIIKTDMSVRGKNVYCAIVAENVVYNKKTATLTTELTITKFIIPSSHTKVTEKLEMLVLLKALLLYGTNYIYHSDSKGAIGKLKCYKDLNVVWIPRIKNTVADKHSKTNNGFKHLPKKEVDYLIELIDKVEVGEKYIIE